MTWQSPDEITFHRPTGPRITALVPVTITPLWRLIIVWFISRIVALAKGHAITMARVLVGKALKHELVATVLATSAAGVVISFIMRAIVHVG
jgi:hypothetical protein